jgi:hypothetical protein
VGEGGRRVKAGDQRALLQCRKLRLGIVFFKTRSSAACVANLCRSVQKASELLCAKHWPEVPKPNLIGGTRLVMKLGVRWKLFPREHGSCSGLHVKFGGQKNRRSVSTQRLRGSFNELVAAKHQ